MNVLEEDLQELHAGLHAAVKNRSMGLYAKAEREISSWRNTELYETAGREHQALCLQHEQLVGDIDRAADAIPF